MASVTPEQIAAAPVLSLFLERKAFALTKCRATSNDCKVAQTQFDSGVAEVIAHLRKTCAAEFDPLVSCISQQSSTVKNAGKVCLAQEELFYRVCVLGKLADDLEHAVGKSHPSLNQRLYQVYGRRFGDAAPRY